MQLLLRILSECLVILVTLILGALELRAHGRTSQIFFFKTIYAQVSIYALFYLIAYGVTTWQISAGNAQNNQFVMNIHLLLETTLLLLAANFYFRQGWKQVCCVFLWVTFVVVYVCLLAAQGIHVYSHYTDLVACFIISFIFTLILYEEFSELALPWYRSPEVIICIGILAYYASSIPYIALMGYLQEMYPRVNSTLFHLINGVLANFRYLCVAIAFWSLGQNRRQFVSANE